MRSICHEAMRGLMFAAPTDQICAERPIGTKVYRRRQFLNLAAGAVMAPALPRIAMAQTYPARPITMIVPYGAGTSTDIVGRLLAERMGKSLGQPIIIENVGGADGSIGTGRSAHARPDGYTIELGTNGTHALNAAFYLLPYDVLNDFLAISPVVTGSIFLYGRKTLPANDLKGLIGWLKANPQGTSIGVVSAGYRLLIALLQKEAGVQFTPVPYRSQTTEMQDLVGGQIDLCFDTAVPLRLVRAESIKAFAVASDTRLALVPEIPTFPEMGLPALSFSGRLWLFAPKGTPKDIVSKLNAATVEALADAAVQSRLADIGYKVPPRAQQTPEGLGALQKAEVEKWWPIIKELGIKPE
jgi:tripartite-type tricarboxylate transporter receptor subunit TctC